ncbi:MAG TPA: adenosylmethionine decarboxylase [Pseudomonadales bacterium]|jgi:S-adenosylmethionine decarboxylase
MKKAAALSLAGEVFDSKPPATDYPTFIGDDVVEPKDHFIVRDGKEFAGSHLIIDFWDAHNLDDIRLMDAAFRRAVEVCGATLLHIHMHHFTPNGGISGVAVLAESHISVHTWPERRYAAFDVFMCGNARPEQAVPVLREAFQPGRIEVREYLRGHWEGE